MKKRFLQFEMTAKAVMIALLLGVAGKMYAYDFSAVCETGQTLYYIITDAENHNVTLCFPGESSYDPWPSNFDKPFGSIVLPERVQHDGITYSVKSIGTAAFRDCCDLTGSITIPNAVTSILESAFLGCSGITSITIPESVNEIGEYAFHGTGWYNNQSAGILYLNGCCIEYKGSGPIGTLSLDENTRIIANNVFYNCSGLTGSLVIPNSVESIGRFAFFGCTGLTGLIIGNSVESIKQSAFAGCYNLSGDLVLPNSLLELDYHSFSGCGFTGSLVLGNSLAEIKSGCFKNCSGFTGDLVLPNTLTSIGDEVFSGCSGFSGVVLIPNSIISIGYQAFYYCSGISSFTIPDSVRSIGADAFKGTGWYNNQQNGVLYIDNCCIGYKGNQPTGTLSLQESTRIIADNAFSGCTGLSGDLIIPNNVAYIGNLSFSGCSGFSGALYLGNSVISLGNMTFGSCSNLIEIVSISNVPPKMVAGGYFFSFKNVPNTIPVYVPYDKKDTYMSALGWSGFTNYQGLMYKSILGYNEGNGNWQFIASPLAENSAPTTVDNMITETTYDLYRFDQSEELEWQNYKAHTDDFIIANGQGYLYANAEDVNLIFKGEFNEDETKEMELVYDVNAEFAGWNLVGNPFPVQAYVNTSYYKMNDDGSAIEPTAVSATTAIAPCTGVMVKATTTGQSVTFSKTAPSVPAANQGMLQIAVAKVPEPVEGPTRSQAGVSTGSTASVVDKAIISFNAEDQLEKFVFNKDNAQIYIPQDDKEYAIASVGRDAARHASTEMPINFKANQDGEYTLTINLENVEMDYLHLIDNLTGADVDLLTPPAFGHPLSEGEAQSGANFGSDSPATDSRTPAGFPLYKGGQGGFNEPRQAEYTFTAKTTDYASRFRLVFSANDASTGSATDAPFAFISNGNIIINDADARGASLQIVEVTGRVVVCRDAACHVSTNGMSAGVYVLRLINGENVKTQKIVVQ